MMKTIYTLLVLALFILPVNVFAVDNAIILNVTEATVTNVNPGSVYGDVYALDNGRFVEFNLTVPETGIYGMSLFGGSTGINAIVTLDGTQISNTFVDNLEVIDGWQNNMSDVSVGTVSLYTDKTYRIRVTFSATTADCILLKSASLVRLRDIGLFVDSVKGSGVSFAEQTVLPRGCDNITVDFTDGVNATTVTSDTVKLRGANGDVSTRLTTDGRVVNLALRETLDEASEYQLIISGVKDITNVYTVKDATYVFSTGGTDKGTATVTNVNATLIHDDFTLSGQMLSSVGLGIAGRAITVRVVELPELMFEGKTLEDGNFLITSKMPTNVLSGAYTFSVMFEYIGTQFFVLTYVTASDEQQIINAISATTNATEVYNVLNQYRTSLGINLTKNLVDIPDKNKVYENFIGRTFTSVSELLGIYRQRIIIETINQTTDVLKIEAIFKSNDKVSRIGVDYEKVSYIVSQKSNFYNDVLALSPIYDADTFTATISDLVDKWLAAQYGKSDSELLLSNMSVYIGQSCVIPLMMVNTVDEIKTIELFLTSENTKLFEGSVFTSNGEVNISNSVGELDIKITPSLQSTNNLGVITILATDSAGVYNLTVSGKIIYDKSLPVEVQSEILSKTITITVNANKSKGGGVTTTKKEIGGTTSSTGSVTPPPITGNTGDNTPTEIYNFTDLEDVQWAKEGINYLVSKNIISKAEDKMFHANDKVTREEFIKMAVLALGLYNKNAEETFSDIDSTHWSYQYVASAQESGIILGNDENKFGVGAFITREDMSVIICRALEKAGFTQPVVTDLFSDDRQIADYAKSSVYMMKEIGIINGVGDNNFAPKEYTAKAQAAKIIYNLMKAAGK